MAPYCNCKGIEVYFTSNGSLFQESFQAGLDLKAQTMIAIHWGTVDLSEEPLFEPAELFKKMALEKKFDPKRLWILKIGETRVLE